MKQGFLIKSAFFKYGLIWRMVMPFLRLNKLALQVSELVMKSKASKEESQRLITLAKSRVEQFIKEAVRS
jgi:hypothetical protein